MKEEFTATVWQEGDWYVAQCREFEIASQGRTRDEALDNLSEAIELHFLLQLPRSYPKWSPLKQRLNVAPLRPLPYRVVRRKLEAAGFEERPGKGKS